ncbi:DinB family protein [Niastella caeni]|uniref:DinB family protein n=1 Tax=Niastella caeni TaxID=2569763 RepID=A0A4S8HWF7_9BACT|nr:DinB family protein [Niastella caeni]THU38384.1 DinB family protein [Niastella caeni]
MAKKYRQGAIGALLDIYENAISELKVTVKNIPDSALTVIVDPHTKDDNCRSLQTVLSHVVSSGYGYATSIHNLKGNKARPEKTFHLTMAEYLHDLDDVFYFTENVFAAFTDHELEQFDNTLKIKAGWGQLYDIEQMTEHAIVHILRHRRQIEKFKMQLGY